MNRKKDGTDKNERALNFIKCKFGNIHCQFLCPMPFKPMLNNNTLGIRIKNRDRQSSSNFKTVNRLIGTASGDRLFPCIL